MTPAINLARKAKIDFNVHEYPHDPAHNSYGLEAAEKLGIDANLIFKTLVVKLDSGALAVAVIPVNRQLSMKAMAKAASAKKALMAEEKEVQRATGYVLGGVSPLGQKKRLETVIDVSAQALSMMFVSAGRRGLEIELAPLALASLTGASFHAISQQ